MLTLNLRSAHRLVQEQKSAGVDVRWDGYTIIFHRPNPKAYYSRQGAFRNGQWGYENRFDVSTEGEWRIDPRNLKRTGRRTRN